MPPTGGTWLNGIALAHFLVSGAADEQLLGLVQGMSALAYAPYRKVVRQASPAGNQQQALLVLVNQASA